MVLILLVRMAICLRLTSAPEQAEDGGICRRCPGVVAVTISIDRRSLPLAFPAQVVLEVAKLLVFLCLELCHLFIQLPSFSF